MDTRCLFGIRRRVLVTGCTGFLGEAVTRELIRRGVKVIGLVRGRDAGSEFKEEIAAGHVHLVHGRVEDTARLYSAMAVHEVSAVFHLAGAEGFASVVSAAGLYHSRVPVVVVRPSSQLRIANAESSLATLLGVARFGELFGPRDRELRGLVARAIQSLLAGQAPVPAAAAVREFVHVDDAARACLNLADALARAGQPLDCTFRSGWEMSEAKMIEAISAVASGNAPTVPCLEPEDPLGWKPEITFGEALAETISWHRQFAGSQDMPAPRRAA